MTLTKVYLTIVEMVALKKTMDMAIDSNTNSTCIVLRVISYDTMIEQFFLLSTRYYVPIASLQAVV